MTDRVVTYDFRGRFDSLRSGLAASSAQVKSFGNDLTALDAKGAKMRAGLTQMGTTAGRVSLLAAAGLAALAAVTANFDQAMSKVAATGDEARRSLEELRQAALDAGAATAFSASEAAAGIENLLKAGVSVEDVLSGGLAGALDLAAAGGLEVADAAEIAATALTQFKLSGEDVPHIADLLAAGAGKAQGEVSDLAMALKQSGLVAAQMGVSVEETTGTLAAFASAGLLGSDAGTSFRTMLLRLANPTQESAALMRSLGIEAYDASGQFVGMASVAEQLKTAFEGKTQAERDSSLATIFGSDAIRAAAVLYEQGAVGVTGWTDKVNDAGYAAETAATRMDNLKGDLEALRGSLETALIGSGEGSTGILREMAQGATGLINAFNGLPGPAKNVASGLLAITAVTGGGLWFGSKVINGIADTKDALKALGVQAVTTRGLLSGLATGGAAGLLALGTLFDTLKLQDQLGRSRDAAESMSNSIQDLADNLTDSNVGNYAADLGIDIQRLAEDLYTNGESGEYVTRVMDQLADASGGADALVSQFASNALPFVHTAADKAFEALDDLRDVMDGIGEVGLTEYLFTVGQSLGAQQVAAEASADAWDAVIAATAEGGFVSEATAEEINKLAQAMRNQADEAAAAFDAQTAWGQAVANAQQAARDGARGLDETTEAGRKAREAISGMAAAWNNQPSAVKNSQAAYRDARRTFLDVADSLGIGEKAARRLAKQLLEVPRKTVAEIEADDRQAKAAIADVDRGLVNLSRSKATAIIDADNSAVLRAIAETKRFLGLIPDEEVIINVRREGQGFAPRSALGNIFTYANGGMDRANGHWPEFAGPGPTRMWREPETGGESYIPHANDHRRPRAKDILEQTAGMFGGQVQWFAQGGFASQSAANPLNSTFSGALLAGLRSELQELFEDYRQRRREFLRSERPDTAKDLRVELKDLRNDYHERRKAFLRDEASKADFGRGRTLSEVAQITRQIKALERLLDAEGKNELSKQRRRVVELELKAAEKKLKMAEREAEVRKNLRGIAGSFSTDSLVGSPELTIAQQAASMVADLRRQIREAGGEWTKGLTRWSKGLIAAASELDDVNAALARETEKRDRLQEALSDQKAVLEQLKSTMESFANSVAGNFLSDPFNQSISGGGAPSAALLAAQEQLAAIRSSPTGDSVTAAAMASELIAAIGRLQSEQPDSITGVRAFEATLDSDIARLDEFSTALDTLTGSLGLDVNGGLFRGLLERGDVATASGLAAMTPDQIDALEEKFQIRADKAAEFASQQTQAIFGPQFAAESAAAAALQSSVDQSVQHLATLTARQQSLEASIRTMDERVETALERQTEKLADVGRDNVRATKDVGRDTAERLRWMFN